MRLSQATENDTLNIMGKLYTLDYSLRSGGGKVCVKRVDTGEVSLIAASTECDKVNNFLGVEIKPPSLQEIYDGLGIKAKPFDYSQVYMSPETVQDIQTWPRGKEEFDETEVWTKDVQNEKDEGVTGSAEQLDHVTFDQDNGSFVTDGESLEVGPNPLIKNEEDDPYYNQSNNTKFR